MDSAAVEYRLILDKARRSLAAAISHRVARDHDFACSRAYYAAFYAIQAVLLNSGIKTATHSGALSEFSRLFVKSGVFPADYGRALNQLFKKRQIGDYQFSKRVTEEEAAESLAAATRIVDGVTEYLMKKGLLETPGS